MQTRKFATFAALAGLAFSTASSAAWFAKFDGVDGKRVENSKVEQAQKPKEKQVAKVTVAGWNPKQKSKLEPKR